MLSPLHIKILGFTALIASLALLALVTVDTVERVDRLLLNPQQPGAASKVTATDPKRTQVRVSDIVRAHLFGLAKQKTERAPKPVVAPETKLKLTLLGIVSGETKELSRALIQTQGARLKSYSVGDAVEKTDARLYEVNQDGVILERSGRYETLSLVRKTIKDEKNSKPAKSKGFSSRTTNLPTPLPTAGTAQPQRESRKKVSRSGRNPVTRNTKAQGSAVADPDEEDDEEEEFLDEEEEFADEEEAGDPA